MMKIKTRLSFQFTLLVLIILMFFSVLVYYFSLTSQRIKFRDNLMSRARNTAVLLINVTEVDSLLLKKIHLLTTSWKDEEIAIADSAFNIIYSNNLQNLTDNVLKANHDNSESSFFRIKEKDGVYYKHRFNKQIYHVYVLAFDSARSENLSELRVILLLSILFSGFLSICFSYLFSRKAIQPISQIIRSVKDINVSSLSDRIDEGNKKDEIEQMAITFNEMLTNLEIVFKNQEEFVSNASHELRAPLAVMISEADYLLGSDRKPEEYEKHIIKMVDDLKRLNALSNILLLLVQLFQDKNNHMSDVRVDEVIYNSIIQTKIKYPGRKIISKVQYPDIENGFLIRGNTNLLEIIFINLLDNGCKFSADDVLVELIVIDKLIKIIITDRGIGIPQFEIDNIYSPFKRASNVKNISGFGIGLSLVKKIIELHDAHIEISSSENKGTKVELVFNQRSE